MATRPATALVPRLARPARLGPLGMSSSSSSNIGGGATMRMSSSGGAAASTKANLAVVGAGWWAQGWHLPQIHANEHATIAAIVDPNPAPTSPLAIPPLVPLAELAERYSTQIFPSLEDLFASEVEIDGVLVCTPHATHTALGLACIEAGVHVMMEKPMTTDVADARALHEAAAESVEAGKIFIVNNSANWRPNAIKAFDLVAGGAIGEIEHVTCFFASPLMSIFDDPVLKGWNEPSGNMVGNGFGWGQQSHLLAWVYKATGLEPDKVFAMLGHSKKTGADIYDAVTVRCTNGATIALSGTPALPGNEHGGDGEKSPGKLIDIKIFGSKGVLFFGGDDGDVSSGQLEVRYHDGSDSLVVPGFEFENLSKEGPESLANFIEGCRGGPCYVGTDSLVGLKTVQTLDAMYRSGASGVVEPVA